MEKHRCKLCFRNFANGRALGGHMRSHMMNLYAAAQKQGTTKDQPGSTKFDDVQLVPTFSSTSWSEDEEKSYGLRENPKKNVLLVDPEFSFPVDAPAGLSKFQDTESESESSKNNPVFRRSKRVRKSRISVKETEIERKEGKCEKLKWNSSVMEHEPLSSISDTTPEEDVAYCLMMLSRDQWRRQENDYEQQQEEENYDDDDDDDEENDEGSKLEDDEYSLDSGVVNGAKSKARGRYKCETCSRVFRSYQALGGHRASHKKSKANMAAMPPRVAVEKGRTSNAGGGSKAAATEEKVHECPFCNRVFSSGQALGGHKRSHFIGSASGTSFFSPVKPFPRIDEALRIDLNLPAPMDDEDEISQVAISAVFDSEFVHPIKL